ncbi:MAG: hypothetical protein FWD57_04630 [Polyangiaceae bacterium]|nr:hypothetical protein [Polyangiaceae bacterium]
MATVRSVLTLAAHKPYRFHLSAQTDQQLVKFPLSSKPKPQRDRLRQTSVYLSVQYPEQFQSEPIATPGTEQDAGRTWCSTRLKSVRLADLHSCAIGSSG